VFKIGFIEMLQHNKMIVCKMFEMWCLHNGISKKLNKKTDLGLLWSDFAGIFVF